MSSDLFKAKLGRSLIEIQQRFHQKSIAIADSAMILVSSHLLSLDEDDLSDPELAKSFRSLESNLTNAGMNIENHFAGMLLTSVVTEVETYLIDVTKILLLYYPHKIGNKPFKLKDALNKTRDELVLEAAEKHLQSLMHKSPKEYLKDLAELMSINPRLVEESWPYFVEAKARRDLGVHNNWKVNPTYRRKVEQVGFSLSETDGMFLFADNEYLLDTMNHCNRLVASIGDQLQSQYSLHIQVDSGDDS
ncbi:MULTISPECIES: hypothetical protein [unclassified Thioalkalivibrio]|uniref:hypothetical protein n=1 Tax=unclassified Thioalkalivibrio TaxID=2621013 RepID=UPI0012DC297E|nr:MULTISPECIES: hypothetical protein [unclassified Thioalkalivibrio]